MAAPRWFRRSQWEVRSAETDAEGEPKVSVIYAGSKPPYGFSGIAQLWEGTRWSAVVALSIATGSVAGLLLLTVALLIILSRNETTDGPEAALSLVFVAATAILVIVICALSIVFKRLNLHDEDEAMGLPRGSVRAVIALMLILLFFIAAIFLFNSTRFESQPAAERTLSGIDERRFALIPTEQLREATPRQQDGGLVYDVVLYPPTANTATSDDLAKQLVTTLATLVTAVAAFYFGTNSVAVAGARAPRKGRKPGESGGEQPTAVLVPGEPPASRGGPVLPPL